MKSTPVSTMIVFLVTICSCYSRCFSQDLSLKEALMESSSQSLQLQKAKAALEEAKWKKSEFNYRYLPSVTGSLNYLTDKKYTLLDTTVGGSPITIPQIVPTTIYTLRASLPLFDGFATTNNLYSATALENSAKSEYEWNLIHVQDQTVLQFYKSLAFYILKEVSEQNLKTLEDHLKDVQAFKKAGVSTNYDVLRVEVQVSEARSELLNAEDNFELSKYKLGEVLGKDVEVRKLVGALPVLSESLIENINSNSLIEQRKDLLALRHKVDSSKFLATAANRHWVPKVSLFAEANYYNNRNDQFSDNEAFRNSYLLGINLTWYIFDGMISIARSGQSEQHSIQVEKSLKLAEIKARQDFEFWKRKFKYFCSVYKSRLNDAKRSQEAIRLAKEGRRAGVRTNTELLDAEADLYRTKAAQINAQIGAIEALINLELASGQKLYDFDQ